MHKIRRFYALSKEVSLFCGICASREDPYSHFAGKSWHGFYLEREPVPRICLLKLEVLHGADVIHISTGFPGP